MKSSTISYDHVEMVTKELKKKGVELASSAIQGDVGTLVQR